MILEKMLKIGQIVQNYHPISPGNIAKRLDRVSVSRGLRGWEFCPSSPFLAVFLQNALKFNLVTFNSIPPVVEKWAKNGQNSQPLSPTLT